MAKKKPVAKKATKATAKKKPAAKPSAGRQKPAAKKTATAKAKALGAAKQPPALARRPDSNLPPTTADINRITANLLFIIGMIEDYTANLRALDRQRHNGVGIKRLGFIEAALRIATNYPQYYPHWLTTAKFQRDLDLFTAVQSLLEACRSLEEKAWNINVEAADMVYTDALEYYHQVKDASERRIDSAETLYKELFDFFRRMGQRDTEAPTKKQEKRDANAFIDSRKDGKMVIINQKPKLTGGRHEVIDEEFNDRASFKDTKGGSYQE